MQIHMEVQPAKSGKNTLKINEYFIHSKYDPVREATQIIEKNYIIHHVHILFGYGCGYFVDALLKLRKFNEVIIVIDPLFNVGIIEKPDHKDNVFYFESNILENFEFYLSELTAQARTSYKVICLSNYEKLFPNEYKLVLSKVKDFQNRNFVNDYTVIRYAEVWYKNFLENMICLESDYSANVLNKVYKNPAVIVSGGPSLSKQINLLKNYRDKLIVICAGSTINSLIAEGIEPDYVVTIDGGEPNYLHFKDLKLKESRIVYTMQNHPKVRDSFEKLGYVVQSEGYKLLAKYVKEKLKIDLPTFKGGASVAHTAFNFAQYITSGPIALIGQDLAYTDNLTHARTNKFAKEIDEKFIKEKQAFKVVGYDGNDIWTTPSLNSMRLEFEDLIKINPPNNEFFNCTEGGAKINGFEQIAFQEFCEKYATEIKIEIIKHDEKSNNYNSLEEFKNELIQYDQLLVILNEALSVLHNNKNKNNFDNKTIKKLQKVDNKIKTIANQLAVETLIAPSMMRILRSYLPKLNETEKEAFDRTFAQMNDLYQSLEKQINNAKEIITTIIEKRENYE